MLDRTAILGHMAADRPSLVPLVLPWVGAFAAAGVLYLTLAAGVSPSRWLTVPIFVVTLLAAMGGLFLGLEPRLQRSYTVLQQLARFVGLIVFARALSAVSFLLVEEQSGMVCGNYINDRMGEFAILGLAPEFNIVPSLAGPRPPARSGDRTPPAVRRSRGPAPWAKASPGLEQRTAELARLLGE